MTRRSTLLSSAAVWISLLALSIGCSDSTAPGGGGGGGGGGEAPVVSEITPDRGGFDTPVTITGDNFGADPADNGVAFNGVEAEVTAASATSLTAVVPRGAGTGPLTVSVDGRTSTGPDFTYELTPIVTTLAGTGEAGFDDGPGASATFNGPHGLHLVEGATAEMDVLYVADRDNRVIRLIGADGEVATAIEPPKLATGPVDVAEAADGQFYVPFSDEHIVTRAQLMARSFTSYAGGLGMPGFTDGGPSDARFDAPLGITADDDGNLYVADRLNHSIRMIEAGGDDDVSTLAGADEPGFVNENGADARFDEPAFLAWTPTQDCCGALAVTDAGNHAIRAIIVDGAQVATLAGGEPGFADGGPGEARFNDPRGIAFDDQLGLYVADFMNNAIRRIPLDGPVETLVRDETPIDPGTANLADGPPGTARLNGPYGIAVSSDGMRIYFTDLYNHAVRAITFE